MSLPQANTVHGRSAAEGDEHLGWLPATNFTKQLIISKILDAYVRAQGGHFKSNSCFDMACSELQC